MSGTVDLQADVGNLGLAGLHSVRSVLSALSTDDVQPSAMLQVQDVGSLFHANGKFASTVSDELQRCPSHRLDALSFAVGWRKGDATSLLAQTAGGQAFALLALFLRNTHNHRTAGEIMYRFSQKYLPQSRCIASVKQLAEVITKVSGKVASMGYSNFLAEQVTKLRLAYLQSDLRIPEDLLSELTEEGTVEILGAISRAQREADVSARITGTTAVGHIMTLLLVLCANDVEISVESIIIHSGENKHIFLEVVGGGGVKSNATRLIEVQLETALEPTTSVDILIKSRCPRQVSQMFLWDGWLAARLDIALFRHGLLDRDELAKDCCDFIWNIFRLGSTEESAAAEGPVYPHLDSLGPHAHQRMREALLCMFRASTWFPRVRDPTACLQEISSKIDSGVECPHGPAGARTIVLTEGGILHENHMFQIDSTNKESDATQCHHRDDLWNAILAIIIDGFAGLYVNPSPKAAIPAYRTVTGLSDWPWSRSFTLQSCLTKFGAEGSFDDDNDQLLGRWNGSSVLYPTVLDRLRMSRASRLTYQLTDGCFILNERYFEDLEAGVTNNVIPDHREAGAVMKLENAVPCNVGSPYSVIELTLTQSFSAIRIWVRGKIDNQIIELNLSAIVRSYERLVCTKPCNHSHSTPLLGSLSQYVSAPLNIFKPRYFFEGSIINLYMVHNDPQLQFFCLAHCLASEIFAPLFMQDCCLNCAVYEARDKNYDSIIVS
ncbi:MAG: hypothetical protein Q9181_007049 [Wetmoreana brouardii]